MVNILAGYFIRRYVGTSLKVASVFYVLFLFIGFFNLIDKNLPWDELFLMIAIYALNWSTKFMTTILFLSFLLFFGQMASNLEIVALQALRSSFGQLVAILFKSFLVVLLLWSVVVELMAPLANKYVNQYLASSVTKNTSVSTSSQWLKSDNVFMHVGKSLDKQLFDVQVYEFDEQQRLKKSLKAKQAEWLDETILLYDAQQRKFDYTDPLETKVKTQIFPTKDLEVTLDRKIYGYFKLGMESMWLWELWEYIDYVQKNDGQADFFVSVFWKRALMAVVLFSLILIFLPSLLGSPRLTSFGSRLFAGAVTGLLLYILNEMLINSSEWFLLPSQWLAWLLPSVLLSIGIWRCYIYT